MPAIVFSNQLAPPPDFLMEVSKGNVEGHSILQKFGHGTIGTTATNLWAGGPTAYVYLSAATKLYFSSTNSGDTAEPMDLVGLDTNGDWTTETLLLDATDAQTQVSTVNQYVRIIRCQHKPTGGGWGGSSQLAGTFYIAGASGSTGGVPTVAADIKVIIPPGEEQTQLGFFTIPNGFTGLLLSMTVSTEATLSLSVDLQIREFGGTFATKGKHSGVDEQVERLFFVSDQIPSNSDIQVMANVAASTALASTQISVLLIDNDLISPLVYNKDAVGG